ncbi:DUF4826 family protein [Paraferrimonas sp. SM1919]|uniref:DUF4826 family protein n=1 Tax=Paraferrimonas sp. SM1919 TaxID=2662263 RepID=UPI0013D6EF8E|nr:DUF4826 family protein [Paraferrimonas sp. SM1919]
MSEQQNTQQLQAQWLQQQFQKTNGFLASKGLLPEKVLVDDSRHLAPLVALWKVQTTQPIGYYWVITGELPTDHVPFSVATSARDAMRHFSLAWQLKAENIMQATKGQDKTQAEFAQLLVTRAQDLHNFANDDKLWQA